MTDDRTETITDPAVIRATDEPDERGDFPYYDLGPATSETVGALDLDGIEAWARSEDDERLVLNLVTEVRRLTEEVGRCRAHRTLEQRALANALPLIARAEAAEAERDALRAKVAAVESLAGWYEQRGTDGVPIRPHRVAERTRAALATGEGE